MWYCSCCRFCGNSGTVRAVVASATASCNIAARDVVSGGDSGTARAVVSDGDGGTARAVVDGGDGGTARAVVDGGDGGTARAVVASATASCNIAARGDIIFNSINLELISSSKF